MALLKNILGASSKSSVDRTNKWEEQLKSIYDQNMNREKFNYDMNADALYKQYAQQYEQNAKLAMQDTVGQVSALTGGYGNSYAQTAGQAVYNQQMSGMNDKALQLYQMALNQYNAEGDRLMQMYGITADQYQNEYNRIRDEIADEQWQMDFDERQRQYNLGLAMDAAGMAMDMGQFAIGTAVDVGKFGAGMAFDISRAKVEDAFRREEIDWGKYVYNTDMEYKKERDAISDSQFAQELGYKYAALNKSSSGGGSGGSSKGDDYEDVVYTKQGVKDYIHETYGEPAWFIRDQKATESDEMYQIYLETRLEEFIDKYENKYKKD